MQDEAAHMMSPSNVTQPFNAWRILKHSLPINVKSTASVNALSSVSPFLWPLVGLLIASCKAWIRQKHTSGGTVNTDFWTFLSHVCQWEEGADNRSDMTQLESHTYWSLQSEFYPKEDFFTLFFIVFHPHIFTHLARCHITQIKIARNNKLLAEVCIL